MVSKVAVIALVAIIAVPILLGYALNLEQVTETEYKPEGEAINLTPLLMTDTAYTTAQADYYRINTDFSNMQYQVMPIYEKRSSTYSSLQLFQTTFNLAPGQTVFWPWSQMTSDFYAYVGYGSTVTFVEDVNGTAAHTMNNLNMLHYYHDDNAVDFLAGNSGSYFYPAANGIAVFTNNGASNQALTISGNLTSAPTQYVDFAAGFHAENLRSNFYIELPDNTKSVTFTMDLNSITDADYDIGYGMDRIALRFIKSTVDGVVSWKMQYSMNGVVQDTRDLYYNPSSSNTYQILVGSEITGNTTRIIGGQEQTWYIKNAHVEARYVGSWPTIIGVANYFQKYVFDYVYESPLEYYSNVNIDPSVNGQRTPTMRMDAAEFRAFEYSVIADVSINPAEFKTNPTTTLTVNKPGTSLEFAGNTYAIDREGNITIGVHKVSVNGLKLSSTPAAAGGYENKIGDTVISVTPEPSSIRFNGYWGGSITTTANAETSYVKTEWIAGGFAWDGIDHNFLMVGLITCLGVFIALGVYGRRSGARVLPLMIVCGGAALLFFVML